MGKTEITIMTDKEVEEYIKYLKQLGHDERQQLKGTMMFMIYQSKKKQQPA